MSTLQKYIRIYKILLIQNIKTKMEFRTDFLISSFGLFIVNLTGILTLYIIFHTTTEIGGMSYYEMLFLYSYFLIVISPQQIFCDNIWNIWMHFINGSFIRYCLRPIDSMFYYISETIDLKGIPQFFLGIIMLIYSASRLDMHWNLLWIVFLIVMLLCSSIIFICIMTIAASTGFWILDPFEIISLFNKTKDFAKYPAIIYSKAIRFIITFLLPFGFMAYYPARTFLSKNIMTVGMLSPFATIIFIIVTRIIWKKGIERYTPTGN